MRCAYVVRLSLGQGIFSSHQNVEPPSRLSMHYVCYILKYISYSYDTSYAFPLLLLRPSAS